MLNRLVLVNLATSGAHFAHNAVFLDSYPGPPWIAGPTVVVAAWLGLAATLLLGVRWHRLGRVWPARIAIGIFGASCLLVFGHYAYGSPSDLDLLTNLLIVLEGSAGFVLIVYFAALELRPRKR